MNPPLTPPRRGTDRTRSNACSPPGRGRGWVGSWRAPFRFFACIGTMNRLVLRHAPALRGSCALTLLLLLLSGIFPARAQTPKEYQIKAAFLFHFAQFVEWPPAAFADASAPISIGVLGDDPFGPVLDQTVEGETINHRKLIIQRSQRLADLKGCHLVFISKSEKSRLPDIFDSLGAASVLTVSETENFARRGGILNSYLARNTVRFQRNAEANH